MDTGSGRNSFMGQPFVSVPVNTWFATPATFLGATWRQGIFSVMQALKATYKLGMVAIQLSVSHNHSHKLFIPPNLKTNTYCVRQNK